jgi:cytochrome P450
MTMTVGSQEEEVRIAPGPRGVPLIGSALDLKRDILGTLHRAMLEYGDVVRFVVGPPGLRTIVYGLFHPDGVQHVLASGSGNFCKDDPVFREIRAIFGDGLLTSNGDRWRRQKRLIQPVFTPKRVAGYVSMMCEEVARVAERWAGVVQQGATVDLNADMTHLTLRVVGRALFGSDIDDAIPVLESSMPFLSERAIQRGLSPVRIPTAWPTPANRLAQRARQALYGVVDDLIALRRAAPKGSEDLLNLLLEAQDPEGGTGLHDDEVRNQVLIFLLAGHEPTATSLSFILHLLGRHPDVQNRVHEEIQDVLGGRMPTLKDVGALTYTTMVVKEAMRLYPGAYATARLTVDDNEIDGFAIPAGCAVAVSAWVTHRHPEFWEEPERFDPERFSAEREASRHRYAYFPFGGGPRACIGSHFSMLESVIVTAALVQSYRFASPPRPVPLLTGIALRPRSAMPCHISPRPS